MDARPAPDLMATRGVSQDNPQKQVANEFGFLQQSIFLLLNLLILNPPAVYATGWGPSKNM